MDPVAKDKRVKREIANSNERRRMQSINAGFQKLKRLLPVNDGEKISKANILQHAADYITSIERDRIALYEQNTLFRRILMDLKSGKIDMDSAATSVEANASSMLTVPLNLQVTLASGNTTPTSTPTPTPRTSPTTPTPATVPTPTTKPTPTTTVSLKNQATTTATTTVIIPISAHSNNSIQSTPIRTATKTATKAPRTQRRQSIRNSVNKNNNNSNNNNELDNSRGNNNNNTNINNHNNNNTNDNNQNIGSVAEIISDKIVSPKNGLAVPGGVAKAAIALPLEVPYTSEIVIKSHHHHHHHHHHHQHESNSDLMTAPRKLLKTDTTATSAAIESQDNAPKGQTLDTICKAIMEIEGDRVFKNEKIEQHEAT